ncbi:MAG: mannanase [Bacteroidota bacterium]
MKNSSAVILLLFLSGCTGFWPFAERDDFVSVHGTQFIHNEKPYYFVGTNLWYASYLGSLESIGDRPRLLRELDSLQAIGITNIRLLAGSEASFMKRTLSPSIQSAPGVFDDSLLMGLDLVLAEMAKRKMKAVLFLTNYWEWSGGMAQYIVWADGVPTVEPEKDGWGVFMDVSASFYQNESANRMLQAYVRSIISRINSVNGRKYTEDPTIMAWQLANEPRPGSGSLWSVENVPNYLRWIDETAGFIKLLDTNHLVTTGSEGIIGSLQSEEIYRKAHSSRNVDYMTIHLWPSIWKWFDPMRQEETFTQAMDSSVQYVTSHFSIARMLHKPLVLEEFGIVRDSVKCAPDMSIGIRNRFYRTILQLIVDSARAGAPIAGSNFWGWGGEGRAQNPDGYWKKGDPFTADPPHEVQGMHSVFDTDTSTITLLREYAAKMRNLKE